MGSITSFSTAGGARNSIFENFGDLTEDDASSRASVVTVVHESAARNNSIVGGQVTIHSLQK